MLSSIRKLVSQSIKILINFAQVPFFVSVGKLFSLRIVWIDRMEAIETLDSSRRKQMNAPFFPKLNRNITKEIIVPEIKIYRFRNVYGNVRTTSFYDAKNIYIERLQGIEQNIANYRNGYIKWHNQRIAIIRKYNTNRRVSEKVLFLAGNGSFNYFHWLIEILPKVLLLKNQKIKGYNVESIVVSEKVRLIPSFQQSLELLLEKLEIECKIVYVSENDSILFDEVLYITTFNHTLYNSRDNIPQIEFSYFRDDFLQLLSRLILSCKSKNFYEKPFPKKFFIKRGSSINPHNHRIYNELEVEKLLSGYGVASIYIEDYTFLEQVFLFNEAQLIVAPSGAVWANLIFIKNKPLCISWLPGIQKNFSFFSTLAQCYGGRMVFIESFLDNSRLVHGGQSVDLRTLKDLLVELKI